MTARLRVLLVCLLLCLYGNAGMCATFDDRLWERYAVIEPVSSFSSSSLAALNLDPFIIGDVGARMPFADFRVVTDRREEVPWHIVSRKQERREEEIGCRMENVSTTPEGDTWIELFSLRQGTPVNAVQVAVAGSDYIRQVEVLGSQDGKTWNTIRKDGMVFDIPGGEKMRNERISFSDVSYPFLALKILNNASKPLQISTVRLVQRLEADERTYLIAGSVGGATVDSRRKESSVIVRMNTVFPIDRLLIGTSERNFQRTVTVQLKSPNGEWTAASEGVIYSFDLPSARSAQLTIDLPGVAAREFRLVFRDYDNPPLALTGVTGAGFRRELVFKTYPGRKFFLFLGNPEAAMPEYDLATSISARDLDKLPIASLSEVRPNKAFAGDSARRSWTDRYSIVLYVVVIAAIAGLFFLQYRTFTGMKQ
ncbi:MAG: DUF3999 domain-containing protein [Chlorobium sp.]|jgi:hypothetical protein|uniref:DUF3999 family protein n=1 Tax=Chlorobium sp. TaxID=1095 RepID=UPI0025B824DA|nr:DUF3999 family protein [Chlorobium sp.]MCF8216012.1 DUF3999 domain-containing protein [Chlorobium sp.]MCF8270913.1 DUF3999 domain-containing protein [Chlorobium sp.]MCF8287287.1 DUF3999 domain-containing protein [Chlorobium sp.]MCF8291662.1 DUF3999 domain-containing protein [Chlorobium sp.]MCF8384921.1 DUF3999 domain-containing protein [Chlorobium sp.]